MKTSYYNPIQLILSILILGSWLFTLPSCYSTEPAPLPPPVVTDTLTLSITDVTHRSITLQIKATDEKPGSFIELYRTLHGNDTLVTEYPASITDTTIIDDNKGTGLQLETEYSYYAVKLDTTGLAQDSSNVVTATTLGTTSHEYIWEETLIGTNQSVLHDVWGTDENSVYAVGDIKVDGQQKYMLHWDGNKWEYVYGAAGYSIFGFSEDDIWVAGGLVFHYDGEKWTEVSSGDEVLENNGEYRCLWGTRSENLYMGNNKGKIIHWDGKKGSVEKIESSVGFQDIWGYSENDIYACSHGYRSELFHFDGFSWELLKIGISYPSEEGELEKPFYTVWGRDNSHLYLGGYLIYFNVGDDWSNSVRLSHNVERLRGTSINNIFAVGHWSLVAHYNGKNWYKYEELARPQSVLKSVFVTEKSIVAVGMEANQAIIYQGRLIN